MRESTRQSSADVRVTDTTEESLRSDSEPDGMSNQEAGWFERLARQITRFVGSTTASVSALGLVVLWAATGPFFRYSDNWQLVINTSTTIVTFLMVFLIQRSQNKDSLAIHLKLNEIVAAVGGASNRLVTAEDLGEQELEALHRHYRELARYLCQQDLRGAHSVEEHQGDLEADNDERSAR